VLPARSWLLRLVLAPLMVPLATAATQPATRTVEGRVRRPDTAGGDSTGMGPVVGQWVTLHRVARDGAGPLDSVRSDAAGRYRLRYRPTGAADAVYFASVTYAGIAYFTAPLKDALARGDVAEITVFDTTSRPLPVAIKGRHVIVGAADTTRTHTVIEVFELSNDALVTRVAADSGSTGATWSVAIPGSARDVRVGDGEISPEAFATDRGRVLVYAPIAPGIKQFSFSYRVPADAFPLRFLAEDGAVVLEVLAEVPQATVAGASLAAVAPVTLEGRNFRRFLAQDVRAGADFVIDVPAGGFTTRNGFIAALLAAIGCLMLLALTRAMRRRGAGRPAPLPRGEAPALPERLAQEVAALDARFAREGEPTDAVRRAYERRRAELTAALAAALGEAAPPEGGRDSLADGSGKG
jgi:hypothetical protein